VLWLGAPWSARPGPLGGIGWMAGIPSIVRLCAAGGACAGDGGGCDCVVGAGLGAGGGWLDG
jgi:hypothetical protein